MIAFRAPDLLADRCQLVLFPEVLGVFSVPLAYCQKAETALERVQEKRALTYQQALKAGQLPLFA